MKLTFASGSLSELRVDLLAVPIFDDQLPASDVVTTLDRKLDGLLARLVEEEQFKGKKGQSLSLHTHGKLGAQRLLLVGAGPRADFDVAELRHLAARTVRSVRTQLKTLAFALGPHGDDPRAVQLAAEGLFLGRYKFDRYQTGEGKRPETLETASLHFDSDKGRAAFDGVARRAEVIAAAIAGARDLVNEPAAEMTPRRMAEYAEDLARKHGLEVKVLGPAECRELGMGMFLGVAQGSEEEPRFIHLTYRPKGPAQKRVCLVGKGVTFDSGGLSLKPSNAMEDMKIDMSGAAAVINAMSAIAQLAPPVEVHAIAACTENMPSGKSYKLGDVLRSMAGKTVEINNTDAEGRLTLGDALTYCGRLEPDEVFDFATLTGACMVALGPSIAGVMSNNQALADRWLAAARAAGEEMWPLPLPERLRDQLKSEVADMRNTGDRYGGALTAGLFLREFVGKTPWVHVDLAGPAKADKEHGAIVKGGTGFAVATMVEYLAPRSA